MLVADHVVQYADPINVRAGERVVVGRRDDVFTRWLWCTAADGREGWVSETSLSSTEPGFAVVTERYEATELAARAGDVVEVLSTFDGFAWARSADGRLGWLPLAALRTIGGGSRG